MVKDPSPTNIWRSARWVKKKNSDILWAHSIKGMEYLAKYKKSEKGKENNRRWRTSEKRLAYARKWNKEKRKDPAFRQKCSFMVKNWERRNRPSRQQQEYIL